MKPHRVASNHTLLILMLAVFVFNSPFTTWWTQQALPWYTIFLLWLGLIALIGWHQIAGDSVADPTDADDKDHRAERKRGP